MRRPDGPESRIEHTPKELFEGLKNIFQASNWRTLKVGQLSLKLGENDCLFVNLGGESFAYVFTGKKLIRLDEEDERMSRPSEPKAGEFEKLLGTLYDAAAAAREANQSDDARSTVLNNDFNLMGAEVLADWLDQLGALIGRDPTPTQPRYPAAGPRMSIGERFKRRLGEEALRLQPLREGLALGNDTLSAIGRANGSQDSDVVATRRLFRRFQDCLLALESNLLVFEGHTERIPSDVREGIAGLCTGARELPVNEGVYQGRLNRIEAMLGLPSGEKVSAAPLARTASSPDQDLDKLSRDAGHALDDLLEIMEIVSRLPDKELDLDLDRRIGILRRAFDEGAFLPAADTRVADLARRIDAFLREFPESKLLVAQLTKARNNLRPIIGVVRSNPMLAAILDSEDGKHPETAFVSTRAAGERAEEALAALATALNVCISEDGKKPENQADYVSAVFALDATFARNFNYVNTQMLPELRRICASPRFVAAQKSGGRLQGATARISEIKKALELKNRQEEARLAPKQVGLFARLGRLLGGGGE